MGVASGGGAVEIVKTDETNAAEYGRRQDVFTIKTLSGLAGAASRVRSMNASSSERRCGARKAA